MVQQWWAKNSSPLIAPHLLSPQRQQPWWTSAPSKTNRRCLLTTPTGYTVAIQPLQSIVQKERVKSSHRRRNGIRVVEEQRIKQHHHIPSPNQSFQRQSLCRHKLLTSRDGWKFFLIPYYFVGCIRPFVVSKYIYY